MKKRQQNPFGTDTFKQIRDAVFKAISGCCSDVQQRPQSRWCCRDCDTDGVSKRKVQRGTLRRRQSTKRASRRCGKNNKGYVTSDDGSDRRQRRRGKANGAITLKCGIRLKKWCMRIGKIFLWLKTLKDIVDVLQFIYKFIFEMVTIVITVITN